jgi:hypothetical protein
LDAGPDADFTVWKQDLASNARRWGHQFSYPIGFRILGFYESIAQVAYKFSSRGPRSFIEAYISMNACGKTFEVTSFSQPSRGLR